MSRIRLLLVAVLIGPAAVPMGASGQEPLPLSTGERVRLRYPSDANWLVGNVVDVGPDTLTLLAKSSLRTSSVESIHELEISLGYRNNVLRGALVGGAIGVAYAAVLVTNLCEELDGCGEDLPGTGLRAGAAFGGGGRSWVLSSGCFCRTNAGSPLPGSGSAGWT